MADFDWKRTDAFRNTEIPAWLPALAGAACIAAAWFFYSNRHAAAPGPRAFTMKPQYYDTAPVRTVKKRLETEGMACGDCHDPAAGPSSSDPRVAPEVHAVVVLKHGSNSRCFNCHNNAKRNSFAADGGGEIPFARVETLCGKCHGPKYKDWLAGTHGRRSGYWDRPAGAQTQLACIACHDPHSPAFKPMTAAPPPLTPGAAAGPHRGNGGESAAPGEKH